MNHKEPSNLFDPYRGKHTKKVLLGALFPGQHWITISNRLTDSIIGEAYAERIQAGWFSRYKPRLLAVDIDDHKQKAWSGVSPRILSIYDSVLRRITTPSLLVQSPRGLHLYWILSFGLPAREMKLLALEKFKGIPVEVKYLPAESLRIPGKRRFRDVLTFQFLSSIKGDELTVYHPVEVLGEECMPGNITSYRQRVTRLESAKIKWGSIEKAEASILPIENGRSNEQFLQLCLVYRCAGLTEEQAFQQFKWALQKSHRYTGELAQHPKRLWQKIECEYHHNPKPEPEKGYSQKLIFDESIIRHLAELQPWAAQRKRHVEHFVSKILWARNLHTDMLKDKPTMAFMTYKYIPFYKKNVEAGYIPLSSAFLRNANFRYEQLMAWLQDLGFIEPWTFEYEQGGAKRTAQFSHKLGLCKFYRVNEEPFL